MSEYMVPFYAGWVKNNDIIIDESFSEIIEFYLWKNPCEYVSSKGTTMRQYGWDKAVWKNSNLRLYLLYVAKLKNKINYIKVKKLSDMLNALNSIGLGGKFQDKRDINRIVFYNNGKQVDFLAIVYYIRCAIAHGRFERYITKENSVYYAFEAITKKRGTSDYILRARMMLSEKTLLEWKNIITGGKTEFENNKKKMLKIIQNQIKQTINNNGRKMDELLTMIPYDETFIRSQIKALSKSKEISYDKSNRKWILNK